MFNFNNREIVALNILMQAEDMLITSRNSLQSAYRSHAKRLLDGADVIGPPCMGPDLFRRVFWAYLQLRAKWDDAQDKSTPEFCCASCGPTPPMVILDGIVMCTSAVSWLFFFFCCGFLVIVFGGRLIKHMLPSTHLTVCCPALRTQPSILSTSWGSSTRSFLWDNARPGAPCTSL